MGFQSTNITGLSDREVLESRKQFGSNMIEEDKSFPLLSVLFEVLKEPMVLLLLVASVIYMITGHYGDAVFLAVAIVLVSTISIFQTRRSDKAIEKLKDYTQPMVTVIRNSAPVKIRYSDLVINDCLIVEEGNNIPVDGVIIHSNDFSVNESVLTGESYSIYKSETSTDKKVYHGTLVHSGLAIVRVMAIGDQTRLAKIGSSLKNIKAEKTPLELQINDFVKKMVVAGIVVFLLVWIINYNLSHDPLDSLLKALTLAMSILPEEIPVAFSTFMAMGTWRLMKKGVVVKQMKTVESLGSATVICVDKTGTITQNKMEIQNMYAPGDPDHSTEVNSPEKMELLEYAMWASEPIPFDPMEKAIHLAYTQHTEIDLRKQYLMYHEYPLAGRPPMMTHIYENEIKERVVAAKGAPEAILAVSSLSEHEKQIYQDKLEELTASGYRILGVAKGAFSSNDFPKQQQDIPFTFLGFIAFYDPPKENITQVLQSFAQAGIKVKIITGDNPVTTRSIANQIDFPDKDKVINGSELAAFSDVELPEAVAKTSIFTRMYPEAKLKIIESLKDQKEIVAMTGDGVNDGPALKAAHIGVAMGKRGTDIAKEAASIILLEDDLSNMVEAIAMGRKIYQNLKKAIRYIISIHIPIIMIVFFPLALGWMFPNIFTPVHIILMELIMGPTCSIIYESEPIEKDTMSQNPRIFSRSFFNSKELIQSIIQGLAIGIACLGLYQYASAVSAEVDFVRTMVFTALMSANIFLTLVNRSFFYSVLTTLKYKNPLIPFILGLSSMLIIIMIYVPPVSAFFKFTALNFNHLMISIGVGFASVIWYEIIKWNTRKNN